MNHILYSTDTERNIARIARVKVSVNVTDDIHWPTTLFTKMHLGEKSHGCKTSLWWIMCQKNAGTHGFRRTKTVHLHFQETKHDGPYFNGIFTIISPKIGHLYLNGEDAGFHLVVPTLDPGVGADGLVHVLEVLAGFVLLATQLLALVEVHVAHLAPSARQ